MSSRLEAAHAAERRERIATAALQGIIADSGEYDGTYKQVAEWAVSYADALIEVLEGAVEPSP